MNISKSGFQFSVQLPCVLLITSLIAALLSACSSQPEPADLLPASRGLAEPTLTPSSTLPPLDETAILFEKGKYIRDAYCSRMFDYHKTNYGELTIAVADNLVEPENLQKLAQKVVTLYSDLYTNSLVPISQPLSVYIVSNPDVGECYSRDNHVFVAADELDSRAFLEEMLGAGTGISEYWMQVGLSSLFLGEQPDRETLKSWYENTDDLDMAGLFIARFNENWATEEEIQIARLSSASLVQYALGVEHIRPENLAEQVNNDVRTRWLESLGVHRTVTYPYDGRFTGFKYSQSSDCSLIAQADTMRFCLNKLPDDEYFDEISEAEFLIDYAYYGRKALEEYILVEAPSVGHLMDAEETIFFEVKELQVSLGYTDENTITIHMSAVYYYPLHEIVHTFNWNSLLWFKSVWLSEGFAEYLGELLPIYQQTAKRCIFEDLSGRSRAADASFAPGTSYCYYLDSEQFEAAQEWYLSQGGQMESEESVDPRLYTDAVAFATMYRDAYGGSRGIPIGEKYGDLRLHINLEGQEGLELSYTQAASFVAWLCDTYSIDRVLNVYVNQAENGRLDGKSYEKLKSAWLADLISKGQGIDIPGKP